MRPVRLLLVDLHGGHPNRGIPAILGLMEAASARWTLDTGQPVETRRVSLREQQRLPHDFDVAVGSGGPGAPEGPESWIGDLGDWLEQIRPEQSFFGICLSFEVMAARLGGCRLQKRAEPRFGLHPIHPTQTGQNHPFFAGFPPNPLVLDVREWECILPTDARLLHPELEVLATENPDGGPLMAAVFRSNCCGVQFHPEASPEGIRALFPDTAPSLSDLEPGPGRIYKTLLPAWLYQQFQQRFRPDTLALSPGGSSCLPSSFNWTTC